MSSFGQFFSNNNQSKTNTSKNISQNKNSNTETWWKAGHEYNYDVLEKLKKQGCRGIRR